MWLPDLLVGEDLDLASILPVLDSRLPGRCPSKPSTAIGSVPSLLWSRNGASVAFNAESPPTKGE